jgi:uroporphyrinogen-III decarboxylase
MPPTPRARARLLARSGRAQPGLFAPLVLAQAAEIEALPLGSFLTDPTKLAKGLTALHQALGTDAITVAGADGLLAEALGAELDWTSYPPAVVRRPGPVERAGAAGASEAALEVTARVEAAVETTPRLEAAVEATARLAATAPGDPVLVAALTGPATLAAEVLGDVLGQPEGQDSAAAILEALGEATLAVLKRFLEAGVNLVIVVEDALPPPAALDAWRSVVTPLVNVTRFHQAAPVMVVRHAPADAVGTVPPSIGLCGPEGTTITGPPNRLRGVTLAAEPKEWVVPPPATPLTVTAGVVPGSYRFAEVLEACRRVTDGLVS